MENDDVMFQITKLEGDALVKCNFNGVEDIIKVTTIIASICVDHPDFGLALVLSMRAFNENPEMIKKILENKMEVPDFNEILKSENNE